MSSDPKIIAGDSLAYDALQIMEKNSKNQIVVMDNSKYIGILHMHEILKQGVL